MPPALEVQNPNHWTIREVPTSEYLKVLWVPSPSQPTSQSSINWNLHTPLGSQILHWTLHFAKSSIIGDVGSDRERKTIWHNRAFREGSIQLCPWVVMETGNSEVQSWHHGSTQKALGSGILVEFLSTPSITHCPLPPVTPSPHKIAYSGAQ